MSGTRLKIIASMDQIAEEQKVSLPRLDDTLLLSETGFDSLAFAILVARLEDNLGIDPFSISEEAVYPMTVGDFVRAYENVDAGDLPFARRRRSQFQGPRNFGRAP